MKRIHNDNFRISSYYGVTKLKTQIKDIIIFSILIFGFSMLSVFAAINVSLNNGIALGVVLGIGVLLCVGVRQFMKEGVCETKGEKIE